MGTLKRHINELLVTLVAAVSLSMATSAKSEQEFVLDFSDSQSGGVSAGRFQNFAFSLDTHQAVTKLSVPPSDNSRLPRVVATFDYADCTKGQELLLENPLDQLIAGDPTWVNYVDVEVIPFPQRGLNWTGGVCYGYRDPGRSWHWNLAVTPLAYDGANDRVRARIWIKHGPIDALKLVSDYSVPRQYVSKLTYTTLPQ